MSIIENLLSLIAPHRCVGCQKEGSLLCGDCSQILAQVPSRCYMCKRWTEAFRSCARCRRKTALAEVWAVASYDGLAKELLHRLKFERAKAAANLIATLMADRYHGPKTIIVSSVPTADVRVRERGYDQATLIAREFARQIGCSYTPLLARMGDLRQVGQRRNVRKEQMVDAFRPLALIDGRTEHVLLIDDVLTTGATCDAAARVIKQAGAKRVSAIVFAVA